MGLRPDWWTVPATHLVFMTVLILKMLESHAKVHMLIVLLDLYAFEVLIARTYHIAVVRYLYVVLSV